MKGLRCEIFTSQFGNCSNHGISSRCKEVTLVGPGIPEVFDATDDAPACRVVERDLGGRYLHVEPMEESPAGNTHYMFGGSLVYTSDGRFPSRYPLKLHDRTETPELCRALSA